MTSSIPDWYNGKRIFVTGGTGFMGKVLVEKLLRSCSEVSAIYLLVRTKRGKSPEERLEDFVNVPIFDKLRDNIEKWPLLQSKLKCINGDISKKALNLSLDDSKELKENVDLVFHMAANVRFDQPLKQALLLNTGGTLNLLELATTFQKLKAFVHVSTSYCHCDETVLEEIVYPAPHNPRKMLDIASWLDDDILEWIKPKLLKNAPNTYAYTKCLTEQLVTEYADKIPIAIVRPSIVIAAYKEPIPGWVDNLNGPTGLIVGAGKGIIRSMHCNPHLTADIVPVDMAINSLIIIGREVGTSAKMREPMVVHLTAGRDNPISWGEALEMGKKHFYDNPFSICLWYPGGSIKSNYFYHMICVFLFHYIPAYFVDFIMMLIGKPKFLVHTQNRVSTGLKVLQYYTTRPWFFQNRKIKKMTSNLNEKDQKTFYNDISVINWNDYVLDYVMGARKYCLHEEPETLPYARKLLKKLYVLNVIKNVLVVALLFYFFFNLLKWGGFLSPEQITMFAPHTK